MSTSATDSSFEVAGWFINRAQKDEWFLENEKIQNLLFLSQLHYALQHKMELLMPSLFIVNNEGFREPNIEQALRLNRNVMIPSRIPAEVEQFLEKIWHIYGAMSLKQLSDIIKKHTNYPTIYPSSTKNIAELKTIVENFNSYCNITKKDDIKGNKISGSKDKKILISQNGPVVVSKWQPRKLDN